MKDCDCICDTFFDVMPDESQYLLSDFTLQDLRIRARVDNFSEDKLRSVVYEMYRWKKVRSLRRAGMK